MARPLSNRFLLLLGLVSYSLIPSCKKPAPRTVTPPPINPVTTGATPEPTASGNAPGQSPILPDPKITPGDVLDVTKEDICVPGYSKKVRNVPQAVKRQAYENYGITHRKPREYEVDHLISLELGGSNSIRNLWPESFETQPWNAHVKDQLENELHREICADEIDIKVAQGEIADDWIASYKKHFNTDAPLSDKDATHRKGGKKSDSAAPAETSNSAYEADTSSTPSASAPEPGEDGKVWVNTNSGVYWYPGTEFYGKTKKGRYMTETEARQGGFHAAGGQRRP